jgi:hypothetical protein
MFGWEHLIQKWEQRCHHQIINMDKKLNNFIEWLDWIFSREIRKPVWFFESGVNYTTSNEVTLDHLARLFNDPALLLDRYSMAQIEQGFWVIAGAGGIMTPALVDDEGVLRKQIACILSMENIFTTIFSKYPMDTICHMWWDDLVMVTSDFNDSGTNIQSDIRNAEPLRKSIFDVVSKIIFIPSERCQRSALHALGHLQHPGKKKLIFQYLNSDLEISDETKEYSKHCITGNIL